MKLMSDMSHFIISVRRLFGRSLLALAALRQALLRQALLRQALLRQTLLALVALLPPAAVGASGLPAPARRRRCSMTPI